MRGSTFTLHQAWLIIRSSQNNIFTTYTNYKAIHDFRYIYVTHKEL